MEDPLHPRARAPWEKYPEVFNEHSLVHAHRFRPVFRQAYSSTPLARPAVRPVVLPATGAARNPHVGMYLRPDPNKPNKSFVQSLIRDAHNPRKKNQANALGELHTMDNSYEERLTFEGFINLDGIYIGVISVWWHIKPNSDPESHLGVVFFKLIEDHFEVVMWRDATGRFGETAVLHVYDVFKAHLYLQQPHWVPDRTERLLGPEERNKTKRPLGEGEEQKPSRIPGTNFSLFEDAKLIPYRTIQDNWTKIITNQGGQSWDDIVNMAREHFGSSFSQVADSSRRF